MMKLVTLAVLPLGLIACAGGPYQAPNGAMLSDLEDFQLTPTSAHQTQDGIGTLVFGDIMVVDEESEMPLNNIEVEILTGWSGIYVLPEGAIQLVDYPAAPDDVQSGNASVADYCDIDPADGYIDATAPEWCSWWWDTDSMSFFEFGGDYAMTSENYQPTYMIGSTDNRGILRFYLYIDSMPYSGEDESFTNSTIWISIGVDTLGVSINAEV